MMSQSALATPLCPTIRVGVLVILGSLGMLYHGHTVLGTLKWTEKTQHLIWGRMTLRLLA